MLLVLAVAYELEYVEVRLGARGVCFTVALITFALILQLPLSGLEI